MFGMNQITGESYYAHAPAETLNVTSMFYTIQGEGPYMGHPAFFVRLAKCNLACSFCDTYFDKGELVTFFDILKEMERQIPENLRGIGKIILVITGGEPTIQRSNLCDFIDYVMANSDSVYDIQIESNGILTLDPDRLSWQPTIVVSPKVLEKNGKQLKYFQPSTDTLAQTSILKFVLSADPSSLYHTVPDWAFQTGLDVYVSPMNMYQKEPEQAKILHAVGEDNTIESRSTVDEVISFWEDGLLDREQNQRNHEYAARYAMERGCRLNLQMHLYTSLA